MAHIVSFDTGTLEEDAARAAYLGIIDGTLHTEFLHAPFQAHLQACEIGPMRVIRLTASARRSVRTREQIALDRHDGIGFQLAVSGHASGRAGWQKVDSVPGSIMILDYSKPFTIEDHQTRTVINLSVPRVLLDGICPSLATLHGTVITGSHMALLATLLRALPEVMEHVGPEHASPMQDLLVAAVEIMLKPEAGRDFRTDDERLFRKALAAIDRRIGSAELSPDVLAAKLGISRARLYKLFEPHGGVSRAIWRRRLDRSREALLNAADRRKIGAIAYDHGFSSEAHFSRAFRKAYGLSASALRKKAAMSSEDSASEAPIQARPGLIMPNPQH